MLEKGNFTFAMIKPAAVQRGDIGSIIQIIEKEGFRIAAMKKTKFSKEAAKHFYEEHKDREFYEDLTDFMSSGPVIALVLEKPNAVKDYRLLIGATNPVDAEEGTIRKLFAETLRKNAVHGSDSNESAEREINILFQESEIF